MGTALRSSTAASRARALPPSPPLPPPPHPPQPGIEDLREKREELNRLILRDEEEKAKIQKELSVLTERLSRLNEQLAKHMQGASCAARAVCGQCAAAIG